jgi:hypothetical protein
LAERPKDQASDEWEGPTPPKYLSIAVITKKQQVIHACVIARPHTHWSPRQITIDNLKIPRDDY